MICFRGDAFVAQAASRSSKARRPLERERAALRTADGCELVFDVDVDVDTGMGAGTGAGGGKVSRCSLAHIDGVCVGSASLMDIWCVLMLMLTMR